MSRANGPDLNGCLFVIAFIGLLCLIVAAGAAVMAVLAIVGLFS